MIQADLNSPSVARSVCAYLSRANKHGKTCPFGICLKPRVINTGEVHGMGRHAAVECMILLDKSLFDNEAERARHIGAVQNLAKGIGESVEASAAAYELVPLRRKRRAVIHNFLPVLVSKRIKLTYRSALQWSGCHGNDSVLMLIDMRKVNHHAEPFHIDMFLFNATKIIHVDSNEIRIRK
jgi:hypothetical protein